MLKIFTSISDKYCYKLSHRYFININKFLIKQQKIFVFLFFDIPELTIRWSVGISGMAALG